MALNSSKIRFLYISDFAASRSRLFSNGPRLIYVLDQAIPKVMWANMWRSSMMVSSLRITVLRVTKSSYKATALYISTHRTRVYLNQTEWSEIKRRVADWNELPGAKPRAATQCQACEGAHCAVCLGEWLQPITGGRAREITITREMTGWQAHPIISRCRQTNRHTVGSICSTHARTHARTIAWKPPSLWSAGRFLCDSCPVPVPIVSWDWTRELLGWDALRVNLTVR